MEFGSTTKILEKRMLKYYRFSYLRSCCCLKLQDAPLSLVKFSIARISSLRPAAIAICQSLFSLLASSCQGSFNCLWWHTLVTCKAMYNHHETESWILHLLTSDIQTGRF